MRRNRERQLEQRRKQEEALAARPPGPHLLFTVTDAFAIRGRGVVLLPGWDGRLPIAIGDAVKLRRPDGKVVTMQIRGWEYHVKYDPRLGPPDPRRGVLVGGLDEGDDVPAGTEVWLIVGG